jgi:NAD(P)-dependent dehydrogenase (short-subunit alcohol dehydrogenase family)
VRQPALIKERCIDERCSKVVAITGVMSGLGPVPATAFAGRGAIIAGCGRTADSGRLLEAEAAANVCTSESARQVRFIRADVID